MMVRLSRPVLVAALLAASAASTPAHAAKTVDVAALQKLVEGLGLEDSGDKKTYVQIGNQGSRDYTVTMSPADEGQSVLIFTNLEDIAPDKMATPPMQQMLEYNDSHASYFTINTADGGAKSFYLQYHLPSSAVTAKALRTSIDSLLASADETVTLWSAENWKAADATAAAKPAAFAAQNVMFVTAFTVGFGNYHRRPTNVFAPGETLITYMEPTGYGYKADADGTFRFGTAVDLELRAKSGEVIAKKLGFAKTDLFSHAKVKELFEDLTLTLTGVPAGDYVVAYTLHDIAGDGTTKLEQPFTIKAASAPN